MSKIVFSVDYEGFDTENEGTCILSGWRGSVKPEPIYLSLEVDGTQVRFGAEYYYERPDIYQICKTLSKEDTKIAFEVKIYHMKQLLGKSRQFVLYATQGTERVIIWKRSVEELKKLYRKSTIRYEIDKVCLRRVGLQLEGWVLDKFLHDEIFVVNEKGQQIDTTIKRISRPDVCKKNKVKDRFYPCGFHMEVPMETVRASKKIIFCFKNKLVCKKVPFDVKELLYQNSPKGRKKELLSKKNRESNKAIIKHHGRKFFKEYVKDYMAGDMEEYDLWRTFHLPTAHELQLQRIHSFSYTPLISIVIPLYNTPEKYLREMLDSIQNQTYMNWELCLADGSSNSHAETIIKNHYVSDSRVHYCHLTENKGISGNTNAAAEMATGDYIMLCDHDDLVAEDALYEIVKAINENPGTDVVYTDEDLVDEDGTYYFSPRFKPDFNMDFLRSINYICHIFVVKRTLFNNLGGFRSEYDGAQDYDLILRCCESTDKICHIPKVLYHWRAFENSTAGNPESKNYAINASVKALEDHYRRVGLDAKVEYTDIFIMLRTIMKVSGTPKVSIIILSKDHTDDLDKCIRSIEEKSTWKNFEIIVVENNSEHQATFDYYEKIQTEFSNVKVVVWEGPFNYSAINNYGATFASGDYFVLLNNDIEVITPTWMEQMLGYCQREDVGAVGAKLYYPDDTVQHAGVVVGVGAFAGHILTKFDTEAVGYFGRLKAIQDISAVTAACIMVSKEVYHEVNGLDESFVVAMNDVDFCLRIREKGKLIVFNPWVELYHYESKSRGYEDTPEKYQRFVKEVGRFRERWKDILDAGDPYYNPNLSLMKGDCSWRMKLEHFDILKDIEESK